ncbi:MAG: DUF6263 family protein, partial [Planctomycetales bacterium]
TPAGFEHVSERVGVPLTLMAIDSTGNVLLRKELADGAMSINQMTMPLPKQAVSVGSVWNFPDDIVVKLSTGLTRVIKCRQKFELLEVEDEVAKIGVVTQVLTPLHDDTKENKEIQAQLIQRESEGTIHFDMKSGRVIKQLIDLDRHLTGYPNPKSTMHYRTRFTETLLEGAPPSSDTKSKK